MTTALEFMIDIPMALKFDPEECTDINAAMFNKDVLIVWTVIGSMG